MGVQCSASLLISRRSRTGTPAVDSLEQNLNVGGEEEPNLQNRHETPVFEKFNPLLHGGVTATTGKGANKKKEVLAIAFVKKYIQFAKNRIRPALTKGAADHIVSVYSALRNDDLQLNQKRVSPDQLWFLYMVLKRELADISAHRSYS